MNARIASIENLVATDPGDRGVFSLFVPDQLRQAAESLRSARRVGIVSGFFVRSAGAGETDGPPGAKMLGGVLARLGVEVDHLTDECNRSLLESLGLAPIVDASRYLAEHAPTHLVAIERVGRGSDGCYRNMRGEDISAVTAPFDELFISASEHGITTIGIGDGGNEIGMGCVFAKTVADVPHGEIIGTVVTTDYCIAAGVSNWGAYGLAGAISVLVGRDLLPSSEEVADDLARIVRDGGAVDGVTGLAEPTVDGQPVAASIKMLKNIREQAAPSPLESGASLTVGLLGYGESGQAAAGLLTDQGHRVRVSDLRAIAAESADQFDGVETAGHTMGFLSPCDLIVASPGVPPDSEILNKLRCDGIPIVSALELAYQVGVLESPEMMSLLVAVTGTIGKRTTVELLQRLFSSAGRELTIGGNRGTPLSALLRTPSRGELMALAVSSFQLESIVRFRPSVAVILNMNDAHLDRHRSFREYLRTKSRMFMNHGPEDVLILNDDDSHVASLAEKHHGQTHTVSTKRAQSRGAWLVDGILSINIDRSVERIGPANPPFPENLLAAALVARLRGLSICQLQEAVAKWHRYPLGGSGDDLAPAETL